MRPSTSRVPIVFATVAAVSIATSASAQIETSIVDAYQPFRLQDQIPKDTAIMYSNGQSSAIAAAADFFAKQLNSARPTHE